MPQKTWIELDTKGIDKAIKKLKSKQLLLETKMKNIIARAAAILEAEIKLQITEMGLVDTGNLRASVHSFTRQKIYSTEGVAATNVEYAPFLEFGTGQRGAKSDHPNVPPKYKHGDSRGIVAYKFMHKAWVKRRAEIISYINTEFRKVVGM